MTHTDDDFGTLRSLLQREPSSAHFQDIFHHLLAHTEHEAFDEVWLPYAEDSLKSWPDRTRSYRDMYKADEIELLYKHDGVTSLIRHLELGRHTTEQLADIIHHPALATLTGLSLPSLDYHLEKQIRIIFEHAPLKKLKELSAGHNPKLKEAGIKTILEYLEQPELEVLHASNCGIGVRALKALLKHPDILRLRRLDLGMNDIGAGGCKAIEEATGLDQLEHLRLSGSSMTKRIKADGARALARSPHLQSLKLLDLSAQDIKDEGLTAIAQSPYLTQLEHLLVTQNQTSSESIRAFCHAPHAAHIQRLLLGGAFSHQGDEVIDALISSPYLGSLEQLGITYLEISDEGFIKLVESPLARQLTTLSAHHNKLTNKSIDALLAAELPRLERVSLANSGVDQAHRDRLAQRYEMRSWV